MRTMVNITCENCGKLTPKYKYSINDAKRYGFKMYCSNECANQGKSKTWAERRDPKPKIACYNCGKLAEKMPSVVTRSKRLGIKLFCSRECSGTYRQSHITANKLKREALCKQESTSLPTGKVIT